MVLIEFQGVSRFYRCGQEQVFALRDVDFRVHKGEFVTITGPSGCGKSTALNIMGTLDRPSEGHYHFDGVSVESLNDPALAELRNARLGFVFQSFHLLPGLNAVENVALPLVYAGVPAKRRLERAARALSRVGLEARALHRPNELSGGQQQRVAIARALINEPMVLLADEPTGALDSRTGKEILDLLLGLHGGGTTIVMVTHDPVIAQKGTRQLRFRDGELQRAA